MVRLDILNKDDRVELLLGLLVPKMTKKQRHNIVIGRLAESLIRAVPAGWYVGLQEPFVASDWSEPEPDVMSVRGDWEDNPGNPPTGKDLMLVVEESDSSLARDQGEKKAIFAAASVPEYWLANMQARRIEVCTDPTGPAARPDYRARQDFGPDDSVPLVIEGREIARFFVRDLVPAKRS
jgi:Uma2 family endonuclease